MVSRKHSGGGGGGRRTLRRRASGRAPPAATAGGTPVRGGGGGVGAPCFSLAAGVGGLRRLESRRVRAGGRARSRAAAAERAPKAKGATGAPVSWR